jgi:hypothetical protein
MTDTLSNLAVGSEFEQLDYRVVYLRPSAHSDERIAVAIVASTPERLESRFISSVASLELLTRICGEDGVEQFHFAANELRRVISKTSGLDALEMPTDLFVAGEKMAAFTSDRIGLLTSILASASCLIRADSPRASEVFSTQHSAKLSKALFNHVSLLNPFIAKEIFNQKVDVGHGETVELPILGMRIFGAPVSFAGAAADQKMRVESYVAKLHWLKRYLNQQQATMYILSPSEVSRDASLRIDSNIRELREVAEASSVKFRMSESTEELASYIVRDEAVQG